LAFTYFSTFRRKRSDSILFISKEFDFLFENATVEESEKAEKYLHSFVMFLPAFLKNQSDSAKTKELVRVQPIKEYFEKQ